MKPQQKHLLSWNTGEGQQIVTAQAACIQHDGHWVSLTDPEVLSIVKLADETFPPSWSACNVRCMRVTSLNGAVSVWSRVVNNVLPIRVERATTIGISASSLTASSGVLLRYGNLHCAFPANLA